MSYNISVQYKLLLILSNILIVNNKNQFVVIATIAIDDRVENLIRLH